MHLREYQLKGVDHLLSMPFGRPHALLADAPGTGKTIMAIDALKKANCRNGIILCPAIIKEQWRRQMVKWNLAGDDEIQTIYGLDSPIDNRPWVICNYDIIRDKKVVGEDGVEHRVSNRNRKRLYEREWHALIEDEAHRLKNHTSAQTQAVLHHKHGLAGRCYWKWPLTGSFVPNRPAECFPILRSHCPETIAPYTDWQSYVQRFCGGAFMQGKGASHIDELTERIQPFMLRRELKDVWRECPEIHENEFWVDVPYHEHPEYVGDDFMFEGTIRRVVAESKIPYVVSYLKDRLEGGVSKIVCFTYHRQVIEQVAKQLAKFNPLKIYGGISPNKREESLAKFQSDPSARLFLLQIASGGEGVDGLQYVASECVLAEPEWSPGREDQAIDRIRRFGQEYPVILTKIYARQSYEETIYWSNRRKREVIDVLLAPNGGSFIMPNFDLSVLDSIDKKLSKLIELQEGKSQTQSFAPPAPAVTPPAAIVPTAPPAPIPAAPAVASPPAPPPVPTSVAAPDAAKDTFLKDVISTLKPLADGAKAKLDEINAKFGVSKTAEVPAEHYGTFLQWCQHAVSSAAQ